MKTLMTAVAAVVLAGVFSGTSLAALITSGTVPYSYGSPGSGTGTVDYFGYTQPGNPTPPPPPAVSDFPESFLGATSEWTYQVNVATGEFQFLHLHLGPVAPSVIYLENPDSAPGSFFNTASCTPGSPCTTAGWSVSMDLSGTITWTDLGSPITAGQSVGYFEYYSTLPSFATYPLEVGDFGSVTIGAGGPAVPEPSTILLLGSSLLGLSLWARKRFSAGAR